MPFVCDTCHKVYTHRDSLNRHRIATHLAGQVGKGKRSLLDNDTSDTDDERYSPPEKLTRQNAIDYRNLNNADDDRGEFELTRQDAIPNPHFVESRTAVHLTSFN